MSSNELKKTWRKKLVRLEMWNKITGSEKKWDKTVIEIESTLEAVYTYIHTHLYSIFWDGRTNLRESNTSWIKKD